MSTYIDKQDSKAAIFDKIENPSYDDEASSESEDETIEDEELAKWVAAINDGLIIQGYGWGDTVDSLCFYTMTCNEDGTVTFVVYIPKES